MQLITRQPEEQEVLTRMEDILREELNVKSVVIHEKEEDLVEYHAKANFRVLGKELGPDMKEAAAHISALDSAEIARILNGETVPLALRSGRTIGLDAERVEVVREERQGLKVLNEGTLTVALDTTITADLLHEGYVRDLIRGIQNARKEAGFEVTDRIVLRVFGDEDLHAALDRFRQLVAEETLAVKIEWSGQATETPVEAGEKTWTVSLTKA